MGAGAWSVEHARRAAMKISQPTLAGPCPGVDSRVTVTDTFRRTGRLARDRSRPAVQAGDPESTRPEVCGSANRLVGADKVGEIEEQKGLTSVPKACDRVVVCRAVHLSVQRVNCWIAFQKASQINRAV